MKVRMLLAVSCAVLLTLQSALISAKATNKIESGASAYLQCDGNPNNMSAGEGVARLVGAVTLLGIFAPTVESPDASKRKFGMEGVEVCNRLIDGEKAEGNAARRLPLILARAIHNIEAKQYEKALQDITKARSEADATKLTGDIYFERTLGRSFDRIESAALARLDRITEAKEIVLSKARTYPSSFLVQGTPEDYFPISDSVNEIEIAWLKNNIKLMHRNSWTLSARLQFADRFEEAAKVNEAYLQYLDQLGFSEKNSGAIASTALVQALAGNWARAQDLANKAKSNYEDRRNRGKPEENTSEIIEILDLFRILELVHEGDIKSARQRFASRSEWTSITSGQFIKVNKLLRKDAEPSEIYGALTITPKTYMENRKVKNLAKMLEDDKDNKSLFYTIVPYANVGSFERLSRTVWNTKNSKLLGKESPASPGNFYIEGRNPDWQTRVDSMLLHSALLARSKGNSGFVYWMENERPYFSFVRFGNAGDPQMIEGYYFDANEVIAELRQVIPSLEELKQRKKSTK